MSIYDKASLVHIPSGVKSGTLYNVLPNNADGDFDFTRSSTATRVNKDGLIETAAIGVPRLNYPLLDGVVQDCPTLLLEPSRSNYLLQSNQFDTTWYNRDTSESVSSGGFGGLNYWTITKTAANGYIRQDLSLSGVQTLSVYAKSGTLNWIRIRATGSSNASTWFDLQNGVVGSADFDTESSNIESVGDGWYRCSITVDIGTVNDVRFYPADGNNDISGTSGSILIQAAQLEEGSYPTSYIPTSGSAVTRSADAASGAEATFNDSEGVLMAEISALANDGTTRAISINDGSTDNFVQFSFRPTSNTIRYRLESQNVLQFSNEETVSDTTTFNKFALLYGSNNFSFWVNGFRRFLVTNASTPINLSNIDFDNGVGDSDFYGKTKELMTFNEALSDSELEALTSYSSFNEMATEQLYTIE